MAEDRGFKAEVKGKFIHLKTWGELRMEDLDAPANAALALAEQEHVDRLLDDIRNVDSRNISVPVQAKGMAILWKLHTFKKVAIVFKGQEMGWLFLSTLQAMHLNLSSTFKGFDNEADAVQWLEED